VRDDFRDIYSHAFRRGFLVSLFTNASLLSPSLADFLAAHPPRTVEVSLYGASRETYHQLTGSGAGFDRTIAGIELLALRGVDVRTKAVLLRPIAEEAEALRALARKLGVTLHLDAGIDPTLAGDWGPCGLRAAPAVAVAEELADPARAESLWTLHERQIRSGANPAATPCGAGHSTFHLDPQGRLMPCMMVRDPIIQASVQGFGAAWEELGRHPRVAFAADSPCRECQIQYLCTRCPARERVDADAPEPHACFDCELARLRARVLEQRLAEASDRSECDEERRK